MSLDANCPEDLFLDWLLALPEHCDPSRAAAARLAELRADGAETPVQRRFRELLRQVTPFAGDARRGRAPRSRS